MQHTQIINYIIEKKGFSSYLEIGLHRREHNFDLIKCRFKLSIDPLPECLASFTGTSDEFFKFWDNGIVAADNRTGRSESFDLIFIDGLHSAEQVKKDFENSLNCLNDGGVILIHDTNPEREEFSHFPRDKTRRWNGSVYKFVNELCYYPVHFKTLNYNENGLTIVKPHNGGYGGEPETNDVTWDYFNRTRKEYLQLCTEEEFKQWI